MLLEDLFLIQDKGKEGSISVVQFGFTGNLDSPLKAAILSSVLPFDH